MKRKVLVVDDSRMMLRIIAGAVEMLDYKPVKAPGGKVAMSILEQYYHDIALVLLDWNMPEMDGMDVLLAIKSDERFASIPVMMVTTESEAENVVKAIRAGAQNYLRKPFSQQDLATRIKECLQQGV